MPPEIAWGPGCAVLYSMSSTQNQPQWRITTQTRNQVDPGGVRSNRVRLVAGSRLPRPRRRRHRCITTCQGHAARGATNKGSRAPVGVTGALRVAAAHWEIWESGAEKSSSHRLHFRYAGSIPHQLATMPLSMIPRIELNLAEFTHQHLITQLPAPITSVHDIYAFTRTRYCCGCCLCH